MQTLIKNVSEIYTSENESYKLIKDSSVIIEDNIIKDIVKNVDDDSDHNFDDIIDGRGKMLLPGMINTHTHSSMTLLRGYADDLALQDWLENKIWPFEATLTADDIYWGSKLAIMEMVQTGTTTFVDMYFQMAHVARAVEESGVRGVLSEGLIEINDGITGLDSSLEFCKEWNGQASGRIYTMLAPHAPYTCSQSFLEKIITYAEDYDLGINIHVSETKKEFQDNIEKYGSTPVEYLNEIGLFSRPVIAAHCVYLTEEDIEILREKNVTVSHNPCSNMKLASGIAKIVEMLKKNVNVSIGTDGVASNNNLNIIEEAKIASYLQKVETLDPRVMNISTLLRILTKNAAKTLPYQDIGEIKIGYKADLILVDFEKSTSYYPHHNNLSNFFYAGSGMDIDTVIIDGRIIYNKNEFLSIDKEEVLFNIRRIIKEKSI
ncbi:MAG: amidohydrolase [bacterium]